MKIKNRLIFILVSVVLFCGYGKAATKEAAYVKPLDIAKVKLDKKIFEPAKNETVSISFEITQDTDVEITIYDRLAIVAKKFSPVNLKAGQHKITWDGRNDNGKLTDGKVFLYIIEATAPNSQKVVYNRSERTGGLEVKPLEYTLDDKTGKIEYVLPKACMIRIRAGLRDSMLARTLMDWQPRTAGRHTEIWDGLDKSGTVNLLRHPALDLNLTCYTLPANTILVKGGNDLSDETEKSRKKNLIRNEIWDTQNKYLHYRHNPLTCHESSFAVSFPGVKRFDDRKIPILTGTTAVRVVLDERDAKSLINSRFEVMFYIDGIFLFEMEEGTNPFTFNWNTIGLSKGYHILTVNVMSYDDHIGTVSTKVKIENKND